MKVFGLWYGGYNYANPELTDAEEFASIQDAVDTFWRRADFDPEFPCVESPEMMLYRVNPASIPDPYPDFRLTIGPRGGVRRERC